MLDIREHGGPFSGGKKPGIKTANLVASKWINNPFPSGRYPFPDFIDSDNIELIDDNNGILTRKKLNFTTMTTTDYASNNTQEFADYDTTCIPFAGYFVILRTNTTYINILDANKALVTQIQLGTTAFTRRPDAMINFEKNKLVITCQVNSFNGYYDTYILHSNLTVTSPTTKRLSNFVVRWGLLGDGNLFGYYDGYVYLHNGTTGALITKTYNDGANGSYIISPFKDNQSYLCSWYDPNAYIEKIRIFTVTGSTIAGNFSINNNSGIAFYPTATKKLFNKWAESVLLVSKDVTNVLMYELNKEKTKVMNTLSASGSGTTNYGHTVTDRKSNTIKTYYYWSQYSAGYNDRFWLAKFVTE